MRQLSKTLAPLVAAACLTKTAAQAETLDIGVLLPSPIAAVGWSHALNLSLIHI